ncbi:MAG: hypothetical protein A2X36_01960 [Elusimicrobia bacterium GWA2_69_24]|nr:MAG: hypothetical protein A2X36_01960 [Elusimicrobia bacterium GWA2_69_24]HBL16504.1 hypothetical protein [Elusimicrobiota bacterium]
MNLVAMVCLVAAAIAVYLGIMIHRQMGGSAWMNAPAGGAAPGDRVPQEGFFSNTLAVPLAFGVAWVLKDVWWALGFVFHFTCHELGHSLVAWLGGYWSLPLFVGFALVSGEPSYVVIAFMFAVEGAGLWLAVRRRSAPLFILCAALAAGQVFLSFLTGKPEWSAWMHFGGCAGELVLPVLLIVTYYLRLPDLLRWDFFRYPVMVAAMCSLIAAGNHWSQASADPETGILWGESITKSRDTGNDMVKLVRESGWTPSRIADRYADLTRVCSGGVVVCYLWFLFQTPGRRREDAPVGDGA